ncbi:MAG TPA: hypothetical protein ENH23_00510 [candidate division Zixibacteria bacterium]|nr:hypothetical protein [candidate division Zixibacteria bacterium]
MVSDKLQVLSEHYSHTFDFLQTHLKKRDHLFLSTLLLLVVMLFQIYTPAEASNLLAQLIEKKLEVKTKIDLMYIQSIIWFVLLSVVIKYFQSVIFIERQYNYLHALEEQLSSEYNETAFTREGKSYLNNYPVFLNWASFLYTMLFPAILAVIITAKIVSEHQQYGINEVLVWFNVLIYIFIVISLALYLYGIHVKQKST